MDELFTYLKTLVKKTGPGTQDYQKLNSWMKKVIEYKRTGALTEQDLSRLREIWGDACSTDTCQGFAFLKPYGYTGDFEIIERIYTKYICSKPHLKKWDQFFQTHEAPQAVRNRRQYLKKVVLSHLKKKDKIKILNIGSGPGRDMLSFFNSTEFTNGKKVVFECLEQDKQAIDFARNLCRDYLDRISFTNGNIFRFTPARQYDIIWASGIFDYFKDRIFVRQLKKLLPALKENGECVIGNFSENNPTRNYMEIFGWCLYHRTPEALTGLARQCGVEDKKISVGKEKTGVNLFLHIKR
jgi:hypothetical protein